MGRRSRECYLCGEKYEYCSSCSQDKMRPAWMAEFHNEDCKNIFDICTRFNMGLLTKEEAKVAIEQCDLSNRANFKSYVKRDLDNILIEDKIAIPVVAEIEEATKDEVVVEAAPVVRNRAKNKTHEVVNKTEE